MKDSVLGKFSVDFCSHRNGLLFCSFGKERSFQTGIRRTDLSFQFRDTSPSQVFVETRSDAVKLSGFYGHRTLVMKERLRMMFKIVGLLLFPKYRDTNLRIFPLWKLFSGSL